MSTPLDGTEATVQAHLADTAPDVHAAARAHVVRLVAHAARVAGMAASTTALLDDSQCATVAYAASQLWHYTALARMGQDPQITADAMRAVGVALPDPPACVDLRAALDAVRAACVAMEGL